jgi:hypothetical protein
MDQSLDDYNKVSVCLSTALHPRPNPLCDAAFFEKDRSNVEEDGTNPVADVKPEETKPGSYADCCLQSSLQSAKSPSIALLHHQKEKATPKVLPMQPMRKQRTKARAQELRLLMVLAQRKAKSRSSMKGIPPCTQASFSLVVCPGIPRRMD